MLQRLGRYEVLETLAGGGQGTGDGEFDSAGGVAAASDGPAWLISDGLDGLLAPVEDHAALGDAIARLGADRELAANLATAGRKRFEAEFTEDSVVTQFIDLFDRVRG